MWPERGIGVDFANLSKIDFSFGVDFTVPLEGATGPMLYMNFATVPSAQFHLGFDPVGDSSKPLPHSKYAIDLLPGFFFQNGKAPDKLEDAVTKWLLQIIENVLPRYLSVLILNNTKVLQWLNFNLFSPIKGATLELTPIELLLATTLVKQETIEPGKKEYVLSPLDGYCQNHPTVIFGQPLKRIVAK